MYVFVSCLSFVFAINLFLYFHCWLLDYGAVYLIRVCLQFRRKVGHWSVGWQRGDDEEEWCWRFWCFFFWVAERWWWGAVLNILIVMRVIMRSDPDTYIIMKCVSVCLSVTKNNHFLKRYVWLFDVLSSIWSWPSNLNADNGDGDTYIYFMIKCVSVTKNDHFLLGVSCNHHL